MRTDKKCRYKSRRINNKVSENANDCKGLVLNKKNIKLFLICPQEN